MENEDFSKLNKNNFKVPEGYFDDLEDKVLGRLHAMETEPRVIRLDQYEGKNRVWKKIVIAASSIAACAVFVVFYNRGGEAGSFNLSTVENTEIINYLNENADEVELDLLVEKTGGEGSTIELNESEIKNINQDELLDEVSIEELF